jgi:alcohol dehydrogenase YqhD (iron-dependent ADH family)
VESSIKDNHLLVYIRRTVMNFEFQNPTRLIFGAGNITRLGAVVKERGERALLVTGGGSVKRNGTLDRVVPRTG